MDAPTTAAPLTIAYVGNFGPEHSTENHVRQAAERVGHTVVPLQENTVDTWAALAAMRPADAPDLLLWTRTGWPWPEMTGWSWEEAQTVQADVLDHMADLGVPTVGFHLDRWWGLDRAHQVLEEQFFRCDLVVTADGGHPDHWADAGVAHLWLPPGVLLAECERPVSARPPRVPPVVWVGSWQHYHPEWRDYRVELITRLRRRYRNRMGVYPRGGRGLRGAALTDLYGAARVVVGDSCLAGGATRYWSDRIPETLGRGGLLVHPEVDGLAEHFTPDVHLLTYPLGDWAALFDRIDWALANPDAAQAIRDAGRAHVMAHHTYEVRVGQVLDECYSRELL